MIRKGLVSGRYRPLTEDSIARIDQTVMRVIEEVGFEVNSEAALRLFEEAGAWVDMEERRVRLPQAKVRKLIGIAPPEVKLCGQEEKHDIFLGSSRVYTGRITR